MRRRYAASPHANWSHGKARRHKRMNMKRTRGRNFRPGGGGGGGSGGGGGGGPIRHQTGNIPLNRNHVFDSSGPDVRVRGTAQQLFEKYLQLGRDATSSGDRVMAEGYFQHAEHYFRLNGIFLERQRLQQAQNPQQNQQPPQQGGQQQGGGGRGQGGFDGDEDEEASVEQTGGNQQNRSNNEDEAEEPEQAA